MRYHRLTITNERRQVEHEFPWGDEAQAERLYNVWRDHYRDWGYVQVGPNTMQRRGDSRKLTVEAIEE